MRTWINLSPAGVRAALRCIERVQDAVGEPAYPVSPHYATLHIYAHEDGAVYACGTDGYRMHAASVGVVEPLLKRLTHGASLAHLEDQPLPLGWVYAPIPAGELRSVKRVLRGWRTGQFEVQGVVYARGAYGRGERRDLPSHLYGSVWHAVAMAPRPGIYPLTHLPLTTQTHFTHELVVEGATMHRAQSAASTMTDGGEIVYWRPLGYEPAPGKPDTTCAFWLTAESGGEVRANGVALNQRAQGGALDVAVSADYVQDALRAISKGPHNDSVRIHAAGSLDPLLFVEDDPLESQGVDEAFLALVMPLRMRAGGAR